MGEEDRARETDIPEPATSHRTNRYLERRGGGEKKGRRRSRRRGVITSTPPPKKKKSSSRKSNIATTSPGGTGDIFHSAFVFFPPLRTIPFGSFPGITSYYCRERRKYSRALFPAKSRILKSLKIRHNASELFGFSASVACDRLRRSSSSSQRLLLRHCFCRGPDAD